MANMEQVERLRTYADISVEEARDILDEAGDDLLEAVILLEKRGKIKPPAGGEKKTESAPPSESETPPYRERPRREPPPGESFSHMMGRFLRFIGRLIHKGNVNKLEVHRHGEHILSMPLTVLVILAFVPGINFIMFGLLIVGLFFDYRYSFRGPNMGKGVNNVMDTVSDTARTIKKDIKESSEKHRYESDQHDRDHSDR